MQSLQVDDGRNKEKPTLLLTKGANLFGLHHSVRVPRGDWEFR